MVGLACLRGFRFGGLQLALQFLDLVRHHAHLRFGLGLLAAELGVLLVREMRVEQAGVFEQGLITPCFGGLTLQGAHLALHFGDDVGDAQQIGLGVFEFAQRFPLLRFELGDAGGFFEHRAAVFRLRAEKHVDLALRHDRISGAANAGASDEIMNVLEAADRVVEAVFAATIAEHAAGESDLIEIDVQ